MERYVPLMQSALWIGLIILLARVFKGEILLLKRAVSARLEGGESFEFGPLKLGEIRRVAKEEAKEQIKGVVSGIDEVASQVRILRFLVTTQFDKFEVAHLRKFADDIARLDVDPNSELTRTIFRMEIKHLLGQDLIEPVASLEAAAELFTPGNSLVDAKKHFQITNRGRYYLSLYDEFGNMPQPT